MTDKFLHSATVHCPDEQLLLHVGGELRNRDETRVREHLAVCSECVIRLARIQAVFTEASRAQLEMHEPAMDASGPRALLKARLSELARMPQAVPRTSFRFARGLAYACALVLMIASGIAFSRHQAASRAGSYARLLPDPGFTPGLTREVALTELCSVDRDEVVRNVPGPLQEKVFQEYGIRNVPATEFEVDYLITPGLGGAEDVRNLWPEPHSNTVWNSYVKDQLEDHLHHMVCERKISLGEAQREIASNWIVAYKKYFHTEQPLSNNAASEDTNSGYSRNTRLMYLLSIGGL
jgi:hypothetical protein